MMDRYFRAIAFCLSLISSVPVAVMAGTFDVPELQVTPSPAQACSIQLDGIDRVVDYDVSPAGPEVAALVKAKDGDHSLIFWQIGAQETSLGWKPPADFVPRAIAWHPRAQSLFVMGSQGAQYQIIRLDRTANEWKAHTIFTTSNELRRLVVGPSPFVVGSKQGGIAYRLFLGMKNPDGKSFRIVSITEQGKKSYQVIGPTETVTVIDPRVQEVNPSYLTAASALPIAFHPAGHQLIWEDGQHTFNCASYGRNSWDTSAPLVGGAIKGGSVTPTPNGLGWLHWRPSSPGIGLYLAATEKEEQWAADMQFVATPSSVPDGRGIVGLTKSGQNYRFSYVLIKVPLADVVNAWMFVKSPREVSLVEKNGGLFHELDNDQLYELYHSEMYYCRDYDSTRPSRPYLVTTDIFWELFAAAYEGLFMVKEREQAIPAFWTFVFSANEYYKKSADESPWRPVFEALSDLHTKNWANPESARIRAAQDRQYSKTLGLEVDYAELKPRGHYASTIKMQDYFKAFRYLTSVYTAKPKFIEELKRIPPQVKSKALAWISSYQGFISPSRAPLVWKDGWNEKPAYARHPNPFPVPFPLSWGFDNEVLLSTVYHQDWPPAEQVTGPTGHRLIPSGLDVAAALGSRFADSLLQGQYKKYPPLKQVIKNLTNLCKAQGKASQESVNLYDRWIAALALQWADDVRPPDGVRDEKIWRAKRLQTGLASWATLRHATVLVNERTSAECGEGGFEEIVVRAPRGYVEPDPHTFAAIAGLLEAAVKHVGQEALKVPDITNEYDTKSSESLRQGIIRRLQATAQKAKQFQTMAEKELRGEVLTSEEYEEILYVGRLAEHHFLVFKSLGNKDYALSTPDPIPKIADVAGGGISPFLMAAVGKPTEWDHVVPFFGRHQLVKGSVYSYYEFESQGLLNDKEWREMVKSQPRPAWVQPFFVNEEQK